MSVPQPQPKHSMEAQPPQQPSMEPQLLPEQYSEPARDLTGHAAATKLAQTAFANGWIDVDDLDRRLEGIANARTPLAARAFVVDLEEPAALIREKEEERSKAASRKANMIQICSLPFYVAVSLFAVCTMVWGIVAMSEGLHYFWPVWVLLPVVITYALRFTAKRVYGDDEA
ncbi:MAG: hypothetical protein Q4A92_10210 [Corynebacterium sp.]|nr:hypothetical protein [Corynebacterium sp.]